MASPETASWVLPLCVQCAAAIHVWRADTQEVKGFMAMDDLTG